MSIRYKRPLGDFVYDRLTQDDLRRLREWMVEACDEDSLSEAYSDLANAGHCVPGAPPFDEDDLRSMLETFGKVRGSPRTKPVDWDCFLEGAFRENAEVVRHLFEEAEHATKIIVFPGRDRGGR